MILRNAMLFIGLLIILSGCSINSNENDVYSSSEYNKTDNQSELIIDSYNNNDEVEIVKNSVDAKEVDIANFKKIAQLNNGEELYFDGVNFTKKILLLKAILT